MTSLKMSEFLEGSEPSEPITSSSNEENSGSVQTKLTMNDAVTVLYCAICGYPPEYCSFGAKFDQCLPWIMDNCPEVLDDETLAKVMGEMELNDEENDDVWESTIVVPMFHL